MKKNETRYLASKVISFAALLALQTLPSSLHAQASRTISPAAKAVDATKSNIFIKLNGIKLADRMQLVAACCDANIYENAAGDLFSVDATTGDCKPYKKVEFENLKNAEVKNGKIVFPPNNLSRKSSIDVHFKIEFQESCKVLGIDKENHIIMQNAAGEDFYLDCNTGDMVRCASGKHFASVTLTK